MAQKLLGNGSSTGPQHILTSKIDSIKDWTHEGI